MLDAIIHFSIHNKLIVGLFTLTLVVWGGYSVLQLPIDAVPDITNNQVQVITVAPSQSALDIERLVTFPVEQNIATIPGIEEVRSFSRFGLSVVTIVFNDDVDVYWARQQVNERLLEIQNQIPPGVGSPKLAPITTGLGEIYQYVIHASPGYESKYTPMDLRTIQDWIVRRQLLGTKGVADVSSYGGYLKQYEIALNIDKIKSFNLGIEDIFRALERNNQNTGGAYIDKKPNAYFIRSEGLITNLEDLRMIVLRKTDSGAPILLRDVATVQFGHAIRYGAMTRNGDGEVTGAVVMMLKGANSSEVIKNVKDRIEQIRKILPEGVVIEPFLDRTKLVNKAIGTVTTNLAEGALIVIFVLVLLLGNLRAGLIVSSVIPLAMLFAVGMMNVFGVSGNLMSLGAIDFGLIVDGAVIIVEATMHHIRITAVGRKLSPPEMDIEVFRSSSKIMNSAAFGEIIILIVYLPVLALVGVEGKMFRPMAQTVVFAITGAFLLSLTYVPMMTSIALGRVPRQTVTISDRLIQVLHRIYQPVIHLSLRHPIKIILTSVALFLASLFVLTRLGAEFLPTLDEGDFAVETRLLTGSSLSESVETVTRSSKLILQKFPDEVEEVIGKIGSSEIPIDPMPLEASDMIIVLKDKSNWKKARSRDELAEVIAQELAAMPGVFFGFQQPIQMRFNELMTGARQDVVIKVYGEDLQQLTDYANRIGQIVSSVTGARDVYVERITGLPQILVSIRRERLAPFGLDVLAVNQAVNMAFAGQSAGMVYENERRFDLVVRLEKETRQSITDVERLFVTASDGRQVPLAQVADIQIQVGPNQIQRDDAKRRITVGFNVRGRDVESLVKEVQAKIEKSVRFQPGYYPTYGGAFKNLEEARARLYVAVPVALLLIFILLYFTFRSLVQGLIIYTAIPLSAIGGIGALWIRDMPFSVSAGVGFIALFGVAVLNGIVLIAEFNQCKQDGETDLLARIQKATSRRLRPVLITAAVASLGFLPMAISQSEGAEVQRPLATVVIGGLISATLLTLVVLPCLYLIVETFHETKMKTRNALLLIVLLVVVPGAVGAQPRPVSLEEAIRIAVQNNAGLRSATLDVDYSREFKRASTEIPKTSALFTYGQYNTLNKDNNLTISQTLPFPTVFTSQSKLGQLRVQSGESRRASVENQLRYNVRHVYLTLQFLQSRQRLLQRQDSIFQDLVRITSLQYKIGEATLLQKTSADTRYNEVQNLMRQNLADQKTFEYQLQILMNERGNVTVDSTPLTPFTTTLMDDSVEIRDNPELAYQRSLAEVAQQEKRVDANRALPDFSVGYFTQTLIGFQQQVDGSDRYFGSDHRFTGVMAGIAIPLWFIPTTARIRASSIRAQSVSASAEQAERQLQAEWSRAVQEFRKNRNALDYYNQSALPNARLILKQSQLSYKTGEISQTELRLNLQQALGIEEGYLQTLLQYNQSIITLEYLSGKNANN